MLRKKKKECAGKTGKTDAISETGLKGTEAFGLQEFKANSEPGTHFGYSPAGLQHSPV